MDECIKDGWMCEKSVYTLGRTNVFILQLTTNFLFFFSFLSLYFAKNTNFSFTFSYFDFLLCFAKNFYDGFLFFLFFFLFFCFSLTFQTNTEDIYI